MKRVAILMGSAFAAIVLLLFLTRGRPIVPRFVPGPPASIPAFTWDHYDWGADVPFNDGKIWMWTAGPGRTNNHEYLFDLQRNVIVGELLNAGNPEFWCPTNSRLLVQGPDSPATSLKFKLLALFSRLGGGGTATRPECFWILDTRDNSARRVEEIEQFTGSGSNWASSPGGRFGYTVPTTAFGAWFLLCDLEQRAASRIQLRASLHGWWNDHEILIEKATNSFELFDIGTQTSRALFSPATISNFMAGMDLTNPPAGLGVFHNWNRREYDFFFGPKGETSGIQGTEAFLLKADKSVPSLELLYPNFKFRWLSRLDPDATHYVYGGEAGAPGKGGDGSVHLLNLTNNTTLTLVPPDSSRYAIPRFFGDEVIYFKKQVLYRIKLNGSNDVTLLPVGSKPAAATSEVGQKSR